MKQDEPHNLREVFIKLRGSCVRIITAILFCFGIYFALIAWIPLIAPIGMIFPRYEYTGRDIWVSLLGSLLSATGYWVWLGWLIRSWRQKYLLLSPRAFWLLAAANHLGWLLYSLFPDGFLCNLHRSSFSYAWLIGNLYISLLIFILNPDKNLKSKRIANTPT